MIRKIIQIDKESCNGCGLCAHACHEGAIGIIDGKAVLLRDDYCDGLGDCLPACPTGAISFTERDAAPYDQSAVSAHQKSTLKESPLSACSQLGQWPVQIKLAPVSAPYFAKARLLIAADCTAFAYGNFHQDFMKGKITLIGCPKLDTIDYSEKLTEIIKTNDIKDITILRMEVPCCGGIENAVITAVKNSQRSVSWQVVTISIDGKVLNR